MFLSYRRFLGDWASGHLDLTLGADLNLITAFAEIWEAARDTPEEERLVGEFGSLMVGLHGRLSPWGGPRFGGLTGQIETGFGAGAEFALPDIFTKGGAFPFSIQAAYRLVQPLNSEAQRLHGVIGGILEIPF